MLGIYVLVAFSVLALIAAVFVHAKSDTNNYGEVLDRIDESETEIAERLAAIINHLDRLDLTVINEEKKQEMIKETLRSVLNEQKVLEKKINFIRRHQMAIPPTPSETPSGAGKESLLKRSGITQ